MKNLTPNSYCHKSYSCYWVSAVWCYKFCWCLSASNAGIDTTKASIRADEPVFQLSTNG